MLDAILDWHEQIADMIPEVPCGYYWKTLDIFTQGTDDNCGRGFSVAC